MHPQLKRLKIIKYDYFEGEEVHFNKLTFILGNSGSGKSILTNIISHVHKGRTLYGTKDKIFKIEHALGITLFDRNYDESKDHSLYELDFFTTTIPYTRVSDLDYILNKKYQTLILTHPHSESDGNQQVKFGKELTKLATKTQLIVETNCDLIFNGARAGSLQENTIKPEEIAINFITPEHKIIQAQVTKYASVTRWPRGIFDASEKVFVEILRGARDKRDKEKQ